MSDFYSLSLYPGKTGEHYYNSMFKKLGLSHTYTALECINLENSIAELKKIGAAGFSVSMPYKSQVIQYLDTMSITVDKFQSCNTVVINGGLLQGATTDYFGVIQAKLSTPVNSSVHILGDGNMGKMFDSVFNRRCRVISRGRGNWGERHSEADVIINTTACGTISADSPLEYIPPNTVMVIDLALKDNQLKDECAKEGVKYVSGQEFYKHQFIAQFKMYTGIKITEEDFDSV